MNRILVVDCKDSFVYNVIELLRCMRIEYCVVEVENIVTPMPCDFTAAILSPGGGKPSEYPNIIRFIDYYHQTIPMLGICLGHQAISCYFGANLYQIEKPLHGISAALNINTPVDPIFNSIDNLSEVGLYHSLAVRCSHSESLTVLATDCRGVIMAVKHKTLPIYGLQFHPESVISGQTGVQVFSNWISTINK